MKRIVEMNNGCSAVRVRGGEGGQWVLFSEPEYGKVSKRNRKRLGASSASILPVFSTSASILPDLFRDKMPQIQKGKR